MSAAPPALEPRHPTAAPAINPRRRARIIKRRLYKAAVAQRAAMAAAKSGLTTPRSTHLPVQPQPAGFDLNERVA